METYMLAGGLSVPVLGYGTYKATLENGEEPVLAAIKAGYRYFDTASFYQNEEAVGAALRQSGLPRTAYQVATKVWKTEMGYENTLAACDRSLKKLRLDFIDVYLIHWPRGDLSDPHWQETVQDTWRAMEQLKKQGKVCAIGVSNFLPHHLQVLNGMEKPEVDQIECHPGYWQPQTVDYCRKEGILVQAWSPLARGRVNEHPLLKNLSERYGVTVPQLCLRFLLEEGIMPLPKTTHAARLEENMGALTFTLEKEDVQQIEQITPCGWSGEHPDRERVYGDGLMSPPLT